MKHSLHGIRCSVLAVFSLLAVGSAQAGIIGGFTVSGTAPTPGADDIYNLPTTNLNKNGDYTDSHYVGQSFTTLSNPAGYDLSAFTIKITRTFGVGTDLTVKLYTVAAGNPDLFTPEAVPDTGLAANSSAAQFLTYTFATPLHLDAGTQYGFELRSFTGTSASPGGSTANDYTGGVPLSDGNTHTNFITDTIFDAALTPTAAPEPASLSLLALGGFVFMARRRR